jgi:virulence-associated protein VagC
VTTTTAKLFKNGRSQAVRLAREFRCENSKEFARVSTLRPEDWAASRR